MILNLTNKTGIGMRYKTGSLVKRKVVGVIGVLMALAPDEQKQTGFMCEVAFGYLTKVDAKKIKLSIPNGRMSIAVILRSLVASSK